MGSLSLLEQKNNNFIWYIRPFRFFLLDSFWRFYNQTNNQKHHLHFLKLLSTKQVSFIPGVSALVVMKNCINNKHAVSALKVKSKQLLRTIFKVPLIRIVYTLRFSKRCWLACTCAYNPVRMRSTAGHAAMRICIACRNLWAESGWQLVSCSSCAQCTKGAVNRREQWALQQ